MKGIPVKKLRQVQLHYTDGSVIAVPEKDTTRVGTTFMQAVGQQQLEWQVIKLGKSSLWDRIVRFFSV